MKWLALGLLLLVAVSIGNAATVTVQSTSSNDGAFIANAASIVSDVWNTYPSNAVRLQFISLMLTEAAGETWYAFSGVEDFYIPSDQDYITLRVLDLLLVKYFTVVSARCPEMSTTEPILDA